MLPFEPQPENVLKARYPDAVKETIDIEKIDKGEIERPGLNREHVFDFFDGLRLVISRDKMGLNTVLHVSASMYPTNTFQSAPEFVDFIIEHFSELRGEPVMGSVSFMITDKGIIHLTIPEKTFNPKWN
jgi:hypothetical protein